MWILVLVLGACPRPAIPPTGIDARLPQPCEAARRRLETAPDASPEALLDMPEVQACLDALPEN